MKILSLFDGISCARVALERAGFDVELYYASEIDKYAKQISAKNYPDILQIGDVKDIQSHLIQNIDLLIGGSPCQDLSIAKKNRKGLDGERSGLFWEYVRILREVKPKWFILENVNSMPKEAKEVITKELGVEPIMINAALVSAQNRKRLWWTNIPNVTLPEDRGILLWDILEPKVSESFFVKPKSNTVRSSGRGSGIDDKHNWDTIRIGLGAKTQQRIEIGGTDKAHTITSVTKDSMVMQDSFIRKLTPIECERLQGLPENYTEGISNTQRYKCLGNAFNVDVVAHILSFINTNNPTSH